MTQTQEIVEEEIIIIIRGQMEPQCQQEMQGIHKQGKYISAVRINKCYTPS